jgi:ABC-2 type transport system permease protein
VDKIQMSRAGLVRFLVGRFWLNIKASYEYRTSFFTQIIFMLVNNLFLLWFWQIFFERFSSVHGWNLQDTFLIYALSTVVFGIANVLAGSAMDLAGLISDGELEYFIGLPVPTLLHALVTKVRVSAIGDLLFGLVLLGLLFHADFFRLALSVGICVPAAVVFTSVIVMVSSLSFFIGESRGITFQVMNLMVAFSTYPEAIFQGSMRWVLYLLIPAAFMSHLPAHVLRGGTFGFLNAVALVELLLGSFGFAALAIFVFQRGLRKYAAGSSMGIRL